MKSFKVGDFVQVIKSGFFGKVTRIDVVHVQNLEITNIIVYMFKFNNTYGHKPEALRKLSKDEYLTVSVLES